MPMRMLDGLRRASSSVSGMPPLSAAREAHHIQRVREVERRPRRESASDDEEVTGFANGAHGGPEMCLIEFGECIVQVLRVEFKDTLEGPFRCERRRACVRSAGLDVGGQIGAHGGLEFGIAVWRG